MAISNSIALVTKYQPLLDELYKRESLTAVLDSTAISFDGANVVKVFKLSMQGLGTYSRNTGFLTGDVTGTWETMTLAKDRGRSFSIDVMDNEETLDQAYGRLAGEFLRTQVIPEIDAYRFAKYASTSGVAVVEADLTSTTIDEAIDAAVAYQEEHEVPAEGKYLFITPTNYMKLKQSGAVTRFATMTDKVLNRDFEVFDALRVIKVPQTRFYTAVTLYDGSTGGQEDGGFIKGASADDINFMVIHPSAVCQVAKHAKLRIFGADVNQTSDAYKVDYRIYHDCFVYDNKVDGIYVHKSATALSI